MAEKLLSLEKVGRCGLVTLDRPEARNALSRVMLEAIDTHYGRWAVDPDVYGVVIESADPRSFCSGGDLKELYAHWQRGAFEAMAEYYAGEYRRIWALDRFSKPTVSLLDGAVMGGGLGISLYGTHRVAAEGLRLAMPEVSIGFFPDIGGTWFLSRLPSHIGAYLALTGRAIGAADAFALNLVSHCVPAERFGEIRAAMIDSDPIDTVLAALHRDPGPGELAPFAPTIDAVFSAPSVAEVLSRLDNLQGEHADWAAATAQDIRLHAPTSLKVAFRQMQVGRSLDLAGALRLEYRLARRFLSGHDFFEGIRARVIDRNRRPDWQPAVLAQVDDAMVDGWFSDRTGPDLRFEDSPAQSAKLAKG